MTRDELMAFCLAKPGAWPDEPWEGDVVAKVGPKIFAFIGDDSIGDDSIGDDSAGGDSALSVGVKCGRNRDEADEWLLRYPDDAHVMAYIGRSGWNTLDCNGAIADDEIREAIDASYDTVVAKLPKKDRPGPA
jgi:predicted DNA-binding protein (MmcQ/YjbR family)